MKLYGLIGYPLHHSLSAAYFRNKFKSERLSDYHYELFEMPALEGLREWIRKNESLAGLNVTIPYKKQIITFLDDLDNTAHDAGAVNTIKIIRSCANIRLIGYNTDIWGFDQSLPDDLPSSEALVLGTGGAAGAVSVVLQRRGIPYRMVSRNPSGTNQIGYEALDEAIMHRSLLIINTTPLGMYPHTSTFPPIPYHWLTRRHFLYDLIYNPPETEFLRRGRQVGCRTMNGLTMLYQQAEKSWEIWTRDL